MVHIDKFSFKGDPNVGLYCVATDKFFLVGKDVSSTQLKKLEKIFKVPPIQINIYNTNLIGLFICANSNTILVPEVIFKDELKEIKEKVKGLAEVKVVKTELNALGNNILTNDKVAVVNEEFSAAKAKEIGKVLGVKVKRGLKMGTLSLLPGSAGTLTNKGAIFPTDLSESDITQLEKLLGFEIGLGTISMGGKMVGSGVVANSFGLVVSTLSSGYEIARADESLGFLNK